MKGLVNETSIAETDNGGVVMVARHWGGGNCRRIVWFTGRRRDMG